MDRNSEKQIFTEKNEKIQASEDFNPFKFE
jgi:hypothetical protein